ncbi:MAG: radical SAM protein [Spirochaetaceae bacterium]|jgi:hypothetical protein|nr:radical SAM protein [Spirochaetaceae bacterium]
MDAAAGSPFTPLTASHGLSIAELRNLIQGRPVYIWGASFLGICLGRMFTRNGFNVRAFLDKNPAIDTAGGVEVLRPAHISNIKKEGAFVLCTVISQNKALMRECIEAGLEKGRDFLTYTSIPRQQPVIEVSGVCNSVCSVCTKDGAGKKYMSAALYKKTLDKLTAECPLILSVDLSSFWREPLVNPDIAEIITNSGVPCRLTTSLQEDRYLEDVVRAAPAQIQVIAGGYENTYEQNRTGGGDWRTFLSNLYKLREYREKYASTTDIIILYILYRNNGGDDFDKMKSLCASLGFKTVPDAGYLTPYDNFLDVCEGRRLAPAVQKTKEMLAWNVKAVLDMCIKNASNPCICQRIFPVIEHDASLSLCHLFCKPGLPGGFLDTPYEKIMEARLKSDFCKRCQKYGLHRLDMDVLKKYFSTEDMYSCSE